MGVGEVIHSVSIGNPPVMENLHVKLLSNLYYKYLGELSLNLGFWVELAKLAV